MVNIQASLVIEILGKPVEHVSESIKTLVTKMGSEKGTKVINKTYHEPKELEESKGLFTTFAEVDVELETLSNYFGLIFAYMPSHIEITNPEKLTISNQDLNELSNALAQRLHNYDAVSKNIMNERVLLIEKLKELSPEIYEKIFTKKDDQN